jgi:hypothetical protein
MKVELLSPENNMKNPTLKEKVAIYEEFLHKINTFVICCDNEGVAELVQNADNWSYAHRRGEFVTDKQRNEMINNAFWKLCNTPEADVKTKERQKLYKLHSH